VAGGGWSEEGDVVAGEEGGPGGVGGVVGGSVGVLGPEPEVVAGVLPEGVAFFSWGEGVPDVLGVVELSVVEVGGEAEVVGVGGVEDRKSTRLNSSH
jgi:hypothetical protein